MKILLFFLFFLASSAYASSDLIPHMSALHTYGGGDLLEKVFTVIGEILYGKGSSTVGGTFNLLLRLSLTIGAFCCVCLAFFKQKFDPLIRNFFLPGIAIVGLLLIPTTNIAIIDHSNPKPKVKIVEQKVPYFLGNFAVYSSELFNHLKDLFSTTIGKDGYLWIQKITLENPFYPSRLNIDPEKEDLMREFCRECVVRDIGLGLYSREELKNQEDLFGYLKTHTSNSRLFNQDTCRIAIEKIEASLKGDAFDDGISKLLGSEKIPTLQQRVAIRLLKEEISSTLSLNEKKNFFILGSTGLLALRELFEAVLYLIFPLVILLSLLSFGIRMLILWIKLILWISIWPIFYEIVNLFLNSIWNFRKEQLLGASSLDLTLNNFNHLSELYGTMEIIVFFALGSIPLLSWILIKGGTSQFSNILASPHSQKSEISLPTIQMEKKEFSLAVESSKQNFNGFAQGFPTHNFQTNILESAIKDSAEKIVRAVEKQAQEKSESLR